MSIAYFDCFAGISGDMTVAALLDLGVPLELLKEDLARVPLPTAAYTLTTDMTSRQGITGRTFSVDVHDHHTHRHYSHIVEMISASSLSPLVKEKADKIFFRLAEAEAKVHGVDIANVHFHEVGAVDSIIDIVATAICLDYLKIETIVVSPLPLGGGSIKSAHGVLPVPAPATLELMKGFPVHGDLREGERVTPTGAAIIAALATASTPNGMRISKIGYGAGTRDFPDTANVLRIIVAENEPSLQRDEVVVAECHIDDASPEILGHVMDRLFQEGALDVTFSPLQMKKNRPATKLTFISAHETVQKLARIVLLESTAIGIRMYPCSRLKLDRSVEQRATSLGTIQVKIIRDGDNTLRVAPEFEECRRIAETTGIPLLEVYRIVERETKR